MNANIPTSFNLFYHDSANLYGQYLTTDVSAPPFPPNPMLKETTPTVFVLGFFLELVLQNIFNIGLGGRVSGAADESVLNYLRIRFKLLICIRFVSLRIRFIV